MSRVWESPGHDRLVITAKGSPEAIADLCHLDELRREELRIQVEAMATEGLRVIGVAATELHRRELPEGQHEFAFRLVGLLGLRDPVRPAVPAVPAAVAECPEAGIRVVMITGDYPATAVNIARRVGRRIFDNLRKAMTFIFSVHLPIAGMTLLPVLFGWPLALMPVHVPFLELIIDPACTIIVEMEEEERGLMKRPRRIKERLFGRQMVLAGLVQGLGVLALVAVIYAVVLLSGMGEGEARALAFVNLVFGNLGMILSNGSWTRSVVASLRVPNPAVKWVVGGTVRSPPRLTDSAVLRHRTCVAAHHRSDQAARSDATAAHTIVPRGRTVQA